MHKKLLFICVCSAVVGVVMSFIYSFDGRRRAFGEYGGEKYSTSVESAEDMKKLAGIFGISVNEPCRSQNIRIPVNFNEVYESYNALQLEIGMDLSQFKGEECILYTFDVDESRIMHIISWNGQFIGGDISDRNFFGQITSLSRKLA